MNFITDTLMTIAFCWLYALIAIGPFQVIAATIRALTIKDWNSDFGMRLKLYFKLLLAYWIAAGICYLLLVEININLEWLLFLFVPFLCTLLAIYYWRAVYLLYKNKKQFENN